MPCLYDGGRSGSAAEGNVKFPDVVRKITPSVVAIATYSPLRSPRVVMRGTGFIVHDGLHVITNAHVLPKDAELKHNEKISVLIGRGRVPDRRVAEVVLIDQEHDLALLRIDGNKVPKFTLGWRFGVRGNGYCRNRFSHRGGAGALSRDPPGHCRRDHADRHTATVGAIS